MFSIHFILFICPQVHKLLFKPKNSDYDKAFSPVSHRSARRRRRYTRLLYIT